MPLPLTIHPDGSGVTIALDYADEMRATLDDGRLISVDVYETRAGWSWGATVTDLDGSGMTKTGRESSREAAIGEAEAWLFAVLVPR